MDLTEPDRSPELSSESSGFIEGIEGSSAEDSLSRILRAINKGTKLVSYREDTPKH